MTIIEQCGRALYGPAWRADLARDLDVSERTLRRWIAGTADIPLGALVELLMSCIARREEVTAAIAALIDAEADRQSTEETSQKLPG